MDKSGLNGRPGWSIPGVPPGWSRELDKKPLGNIIGLVTIEFFV